MDFDRGEAANLNPEAFVEHSEPAEVNDSWLRSAEPDEQVEAMRHWWHARFEDPAHSTPYESAAGGYLFINGGPYDPSDELSGRFSHLVEHDTVRRLVKELGMEVGDEWAPKGWFDDELDVEPGQRHEPLMHLDWSLDSDFQKLMDLAESTKPGRSVLERHAYITLVAAMETYLWETTKYWVERDDEVLKRLVTSYPRYKERSLKLSDIFSRYASLREEISKDLRGMVWHRLDDVQSIMKCAFDAELPDMKTLAPCMVLRHDLVHRNGRNSNGEPVYLERAHIDRLMRLVLELCIAVETIVNTKWPDETAKHGLATLKGRLEQMRGAGREDPPPPPELF